MVDNFQPIVKLNEHDPVLQPDSRATFSCPIRKKDGRWEEKDVFNPAAVVRDKEVWLLLPGADGWVCRMALRGLGWPKAAMGLTLSAILRRCCTRTTIRCAFIEWEGGCEDPRVVRRDDGLYIMTYTAYDGTIARLCVASSTVLVNWKKHGLAFQDGKYRDLWSKSGPLG